jgi:acyl-CoA thioester hydrolase
MHLPETFHFFQTRRVEFSDTDMAGIAHFTNLLKFVELAEHAFFRSLGVKVYEAAGGASAGWPRVETTCRYLKPAKFEQLLDICLCIEEVRETGLKYGFWIFNEGSRSREALIAAGTMTLVHATLDIGTGTIRKTPLPDSLRHLLPGSL